MFRVRVLAGLLPALLLSGCFQLKALLRVSDDGSAVLEETVLISGMLRDMLSADSTRGSQLYVLDSLRANASRLGEGVTLLRVDTVREADGYGYRAVYSIPDVTQLRFRFNPRPLPGDDLASARRSTSFLAATSDDQAVTFDRDAAGSLRVLLPRRPESGPMVEPSRASVTALADTLRRNTQNAGAELLEALGGVRFAFEVAGTGPVESTDARFGADSSVVLFDYTLGSFFGLARDKPELVARAQLLERVGTPDHGPVVAALAMQPDVRYEVRPVVTVRFAR
jgi:hypothetical protein